MAELKYQLAHHTPKLMDSSREFAVLVPLVEQDGALSLLFEVRAESLRRQPGEICFPGGKMEEGETSIQSALRETEEELGLSAGHFEVLGQMDFLAHRANYLIHPVLATCRGEALDDLRLNGDEVAEIFCVPLRHLQNHPNLVGHCTLNPMPEDGFPYELLGVPEDYRWKAGRETICAYHWEDKVIWGITARIVRNLLRQLEVEG